MDPSGVSEALYAGECRYGGGEAYVLYERKPGTPLYVLEGNGSRDSHQGPGYAVGDTMYTLNTVEQHAVCYAIEGHVVDRNTRNNGKGWCTDVSPTLNTQDRHAVCYEGNDG